MNKTKKRVRRTREEIEMDKQFSASGRREAKKWQTSWDKYSRPVVRLNFVWHYERLKIIEVVADTIDITTEAFIRSAAYQRAIFELQNEPSGNTEYKRVLSGRYYKRCDVVALSWRWREPNVQLVDKAAQKMGIDFKTFIDLAAYEQAVQTAQTAGLTSVMRDVAWYVKCIQEDPDFGAWAKDFITANPDFIKTYGESHWV